MPYKILSTDKYDDEVFEIVMYIATSSGDKNRALNYLGKIEQKTKILEDYPEAGSIPRNSTIRKQGFRILFVAEHHAIFYKIDDREKKVILYHIVDTRRDYETLVK